MRMVAIIAEMLKRERMPHTAFRHPPAYTAQEQAAVSHIPGRCWAKVVICIVDDQPAQAGLAREDEVAALYPDCEVGALPPFGSVYGHKTFVDGCLVGEPEMVFNAGTHTNALCMHYWDFAELAKPIVGTFGQAPVRSGQVAQSRTRPTGANFKTTL